MDSFDISDSTQNTIKLLTYSVDTEEEFDNWIKDRIIKDVEKKKYNKDYGKKYIGYILNKLDNQNRYKKIEILQRSYYAKKNNILYNSEKLYNDRQIILEKRLHQSLENIKSLYKLNNNIVGNLNNYIKKIINIDNEYNNSDEIQTNLPSLENLKKSKGVNEDDFNNKLNDILERNIDQNKYILKKNIEEFKFIYINLISNYEFIYQIRSIVDYLKLLRDKKTGNIKTPSKKEIDNIVKNMIDESLNEFLIENKY